MLRFRGKSAARGLVAVGKVRRAKPRQEGWIAAPLIVAVVASLPAARFACGEELRVETEIVVGSETKPVAQNLTLFSSGLVYDFSLSGPPEITVFDLPRGRFVLLNPDRKSKTTLTAQELIDHASAIKVRAREVDGVIAAAADPHFEKSRDAEDGWLRLANPVITYRARTVSADPSSAAASYCNFADWSARLNALRPGNLPPFARMDLNEALLQDRLLPLEVELTVEPGDRLLGRKLVIRSRHRFNSTLSRSDRERIERAGSYLVEFEAVSPDEYRKQFE